MTQKTVQVVLLGNRVPLPVGSLEVPEQNRCLCIALGVVAPDVHIPLRTALGRPAGPLEPGMQVTGVVQHQVQNHAHALAVGRREEPVEGGEIPQIRMDSGEIRDVVAPIPQGGGIDRGQPEGIDPQPTQIGQPRRKPLEITGAIAIPIGIAANDQLIDDRP